MDEIFAVLEVLRSGDLKAFRNLAQNIISRLADKAVSPNEEPVKRQCIVSLRKLLSLNDEELQLALNNEKEFEIVLRGEMRAELALALRNKHSQAMCCTSCAYDDAARTVENFGKAKP